MAELSDENPKDNYLNILSRLRYLNPLSEVGIVNAFSKADLRQIIVRHGLGRLIKPDDPKQKVCFLMFGFVDSYALAPCCFSYRPDTCFTSSSPVVCCDNH